MRERIAVTVLGRLAVDHEFQKQRLGAYLLKDATLRTLLISREIGIRAMLVHAFSDQAKCF